MNYHSLPPLNEESVSRVRADKGYIKAEKARQWFEIKERIKRFRDVKLKIPLDFSQSSDEEVLEILRNG